MRDGHRARIDIAGSAPLVGRGGELERLEARLALALGRRPQLAAVSGDAGIGKTRLVQEFLARSQSRALGRIAHCSEHLAAPYAPFVMLLGRGIADGSLRGAAARRAGQLVRALTTASDASLQAEAPEPERFRARMRLFLELRDALLALVAGRPTILVIEDVHAADASSAHFLEFLVQELDAAALPLMLVLTHRAQEPMERALERVIQTPNCVLVSVKSLEELEVHELIQGHGIARPSRELVATLYGASRGNPLYVREVLRRLQSLDAFDERGGFVEARMTRAELAPPRDLVELTEHRLAALPAAAAETLRVAAVLGDELDPAFLARVLERDVASELDALVAAGLVAERVGGLGFAHPLLRQVAYEQVSRETRRALHRRIAELLRSSGAEPEPTLAIAHHLLEAGGDGDENTLRTFWSAGLQAHRVADWRGAIRLFHAAISLARRLSVPRAQLGWLQYWAGRAHQNDDDTPAGVELLREAAAIGKAESDLELWARAVHAAASHDLATSSGSARRSVDTRALEEVLAAVGSERPDLRIPLLCVCCSVRMNVWNFDTGLRFGQEAVALASLPGAEEQRAEAESTLGMARLGMGDATGALEHLERARRAAVANGDAELEANSLARSALASWMIGKTDEAERAAFSAGQRFESLRHRRGQTLAAAIRTALAAVRGDFTLTEQLGRQCKRLYEQSEYYFAVLLLYPALFEARSALGDAVGAEAALDEWRATGQGGTGLSRLIALVRAGRLDEARQRLKEDPRLLGLARLPSMISVGVIGALAEAAAAVEDAGLAAELESCIEKLPDPAAIGSSGSPHSLPWTRGVLARLLGRSTQSERYLVQAIGAAERGAALPELGRAHLELGRLLADSSERAREAAEHGIAALDLFERLGMPRDAASARSLLDRLPGVPAAAAGGPPKYLLMSDMVRSTQISVAAGDEVYLSLVDAHRAILRRRLRERGGVEVDTAGDGLFAWLRSAADAVWCGLEAQRDVAELAPSPHGQRLEIRIGVTSGRPIERGGRLYGAAVNLSERLCKAASPGEVVVSESLLTELPVGLETSPLGRLNLASFPEPVEVHRVRLASHQ